MEDVKLLIKPREAAKLIGIAPQTLASWRSHGKGPRYFKHGRIVGYRLKDLERWVAERVINTEMGGGKGGQHRESGGGKS